MKGWKSGIGKWFLAAIFVVSFFGFQTSVFAAIDYSGGLLDGKTINLSTSPTDYVGTTIKLTDNNESTFETVETGSQYGANKDGLVYDFARPTNITGYQLKVSSTIDLNITFFKSDGTTQVITGSSLVGTGTQKVVTVDGVIKIHLHNSWTASTAKQVYEFNVFGTTVPETPVLNAEAENQTIILTWNKILDADSYIISRSLNQGGPYTVIASGVTDTTYTDKDVVPLTTYYYVVNALNEAGESSQSNKAHATPQAAVQPSLDRAILTIYLTNGTEKEYDLSMTEVNAFIDWYDQKDAGVGPAKYAFSKTWNQGPFSKRTEYVIFDKILTFNVDEYLTKE